MLKSVGGRTHLGDQGHVIAETVVVVASNVAVLAVDDGARDARERVPDGRPSAVFGSGTLDLVGRRGKAPREVSWESPREGGRVDFVSHATKVTEG